MHLHACGHLPTALRFALTSERSGQGASPLKPTTPAKSLTVTSTPAAAELTDEAPGARTPVCMLCYTTSDVHQMHTIGCVQTRTAVHTHTQTHMHTHVYTHMHT